MTDQSTTAGQHPEEVAGSSFVAENFYLIRKLHSLLGLVFAGYVFFHIAINASIIGGAEAYTSAAQSLEILPITMLRILEALFIFGPIVAHALIGIFILGEARYNVSEYGYKENWLYTLQRVTGVILLFTIGFHVWQMWWPHQVNPEVESITTGFVAGAMQPGATPLGWAVPVIYLLLVLAASFHAANGVWEFLCRWGVAQTPPGQRRVRKLTTALGILLAVFGVWAVLLFSFGDLPTTAETAGHAGALFELIAGLA